MPNPAPTSGDVVVTTKSGTVIFKIAATPTITGVSNENAKTGDSVYIYGTYLKSIQTFTFAGTSITSFVSSVMEVPWVLFCQHFLKADQYLLQHHLAQLPRCTM